MAINEFRFFFIYPVLILKSVFSENDIYQWIFNKGKVISFINFTKLTINTLKLFQYFTGTAPGNYKS